MDFFLSVVESDLPEDMTIREYRRMRQQRIKRTSIVNGTTGLTNTRNYLCAVGPERDPARDVVVITVELRRP